MKKVPLFLLFVLCFGFTRAQTLSKADVIEVKVRNSGAIIQNGQVKGYYTFLNVEKKDRKNNNYLLSITDENLREINTVSIVRPNTYLLIEGAFNGEAFGFLFYDSRERKIELIAYDKTLKQTGKVNKELKNKYANAAYGYIAQGHAPMQPYLIAVPNQGFLYYGIKEDSKSEYEIEFYSNAMKKGWAAYATKDDYDFENAGEGFVDETYVGSLLIRRKGLLSTDADIDLVVHTVANGKELFRIPVATPKYNLSLSEVFFDKAKQQFTVFGEYFNKGDNVIKGESQGFSTVILDMTGKIISERTNAWSDIAKMVPAKDKEAFDDRDIIFHEYVKTSDGEIFAIGEQYKKGGTPMSAKLNIFDMVVLQFNADYSIKKVHVFEKDKNSFSLGSGMLFSTKMLSYVAKAYGGFDFVFSQISPDKSTFVVSYVNYDRERGEKGKNVLGSIIYTPEKTFAVDKLTLNRKSSKYFVYRAKEGYVLVSEYFEKEKRLDSRLEKLNY
jgi:hypothetical protein